VRIDNESRYKLQGWSATRPPNTGTARSVTPVNVTTSARSKLMPIRFEQRFATTNHKNA
jgi:hypothetical protein